MVDGEDEPEGGRGSDADVLDLALPHHSWQINPGDLQHIPAGPQCDGQR